MTLVVPMLDHVKDLRDARLAALDGGYLLRRAVVHDADGAAEC